MKKFCLLATLAGYNPKTKESFFYVTTVTMYFGFINYTNSVHIYSDNQRLNQVQVVELRESLELRYGKLEIIWA